LNAPYPANLYISPPLSLEMLPLNTLSNLELDMNPLAKKKGGGGKLMVKFILLKKFKSLRGKG